MTAAVEDDQAAAAGPSPRQQHLAEWLEAVAAADKMLRQVIADELAEDIPALEQDQAKAAGALEEAYAALQGPGQVIAGLDAGIAVADTDRAGWQAKLTDETPREERAIARFQHAECEADIARLRQRREFAEAELLPLRDAWNKARASLDEATAALEGRKLNASQAFAYYAAGQKTGTYTGFRFGLALEVALRDMLHYEHAAAIDYMLHLCRVSGFRTEDHADVLPSDAEQARRFWDQVHADAMASALADPGPSAQGIMAQMEAEIIGKTLPQTAHVDDYRDPRTAVPRFAREGREYMQYQSLRDLGLR